MLPITTMGARLAARPPAVVARQTYEDDPLSFCSLKKDVASPSARAHHWHIVAISVSAAHNPLLDYMHEALEHERLAQGRADAGACAGAGGPQEGTGAGDDRDDPRGGVKLSDLLNAIRQGGDRDGPRGGVKCSDLFTAGQGGGAGGPQQGSGAVVDLAGPRGGRRTWPWPWPWPWS
jgi:hypothetical protein